jgi:hypothetical protein
VNCFFIVRSRDETTRNDREVAGNGRPLNHGFH